ncbi:hypothetical protein SCP_0900520 [Sparassis crispa]|uniref:BTB domain-containing protein n=1 Tax=Sparassis crispa TaxID=139825 RepID=A0A401GVC9_9APHY|nr:hypothetical protein SCP_0900520 [Sparassis crispa]GBE86175.1 hypothetical protein SCP_0900520 [Sparassis crispa]
MGSSPLNHYANLRALIQSDVWFSDGNIVLLAGQAAFKVHRGQLERHSDVFRDLFLIPQPPQQETIEGCSWVELHDSPPDVLHLLRALYDGMYFAQPSAGDFPAVAAVLRLSTKYMIEHLRLRCLSRLEADWPTTLVGWDVRETQVTDSLGRYKPRQGFPHPVLVIQLALEFGLDALLPSAFYDLSRYAPRKILSGCEISVLPFPPPHPSSPPEPGAPPVTEEKISVCLSQHEVYTTLAGRETCQRYVAAFIDRELSLRPISAGCQNKQHDQGRACRESFYFIMLNILRSVGGIACGRDADPLFTLLQAVDMLSRTDFSDGEKQCGLKLCAACKADFAESAAKAREDVWTQIPSWFGLTIED